MCGLAGSVTKRGIILSALQLEQRAQILKGLLVANEVRGGHSTGIGVISSTSCVIEKELGGARDFIRRRKVKRLLKSNFDVLIGHTRLATHGGISKINAHPFREGSIIGAHNGIISNYLSLDDTATVDSQALLRALDKEGNDYSSVFEKVSGSAALSWYDFNNPDFLFLVSHSNPLSFAFVPSLKSIFWSSEKVDLEVVLSSTVARYYPTDCVQDEVYKINLNTLEKETQSIDFSRSFYPWRNQGGYGEGGYRDCGMDEDEELTEFLLQNQGKNKRARVISVREIDDQSSKEPLSQYASLVEDCYKRTVIDGCTLCGALVRFECWYDYEEDEVLCKHCQSFHETPDDLVSIDFLNDYHRLKGAVGDAVVSGEVI